MSIESAPKYFRTPAAADAYAQAEQALNDNPNAQAAEFHSGMKEVTGTQRTLYIAALAAVGLTTLGSTATQAANYTDNTEKPSHHVVVDPEQIKKTFEEQQGKIVKYNPNLEGPDNENVSFNDSESAEVMFNGFASNVFPNKTIVAGVANSRESATGGMYTITGSDGKQLAYNLSQGYAYNSNNFSDKITMPSLPAGYAEIGSAYNMPIIKAADGFTYTLKATATNTFIWEQGEALGIYSEKYKLINNSDIKIINITTGGIPQDANGQDIPGIVVRSPNLINHNGQQVLAFYDPIKNQVNLFNGTNIISGVNLIEGIDPKVGIRKISFTYNDQGELIILNNGKYDGRNCPSMFNTVTRKTDVLTKPDGTHVVPSSNMSFFHMAITKHTNEEAGIYTPAGSTGMVSLKLVPAETNTPPTIQASPALSINETVAAQPFVPQVVQTLEVTDANATDVITATIATSHFSSYFSITKTAGNPRIFEIRQIKALDYEDPNLTTEFGKKYAIIDINVTDGNAGTPVKYQSKFEVKNINEAPVLASPTTYDNVTSGTPGILAKVSVTDPEDHELTVSFTGGFDPNLFEVKVEGTDIVVRSKPNTPAGEYIGKIIANDRNGGVVETGEVVVKVKEAVMTNLNTPNSDDCVVVSSGSKKINFTSLIASPQWSTNIGNIDQNGLLTLNNLQPGVYKVKVIAKHPVNISIQQSVEFQVNVFYDFATKAQFKRSDMTMREIFNVPLGSIGLSPSAEFEGNQDGAAKIENGHFIFTPQKPGNYSIEMKDGANSLPINIKVIDMTVTRLVIGEEKPLLFNRAKNVIEYTFSEPSSQNSESGSHTSNSQGHFTRLYNSQGGTASGMDVKFYHSFIAGKDPSKQYLSENFIEPGVRQANLVVTSAQLKEQVDIGGNADLSTVVHLTPSNAPAGALPYIEPVAVIKATYVSYVSNETNEVPEGNSISDVFPNPGGFERKIYISLNEPSHVSTKIYSLTGQEIFTEDRGILSAGAHPSTFQLPSSTASGTYLLVTLVQSPNGKIEKYTKKITLIK